MLKHIEMFNDDPAKSAAEEAIHNVYKLPSIEHPVRYPHAEAGLPIKDTWIKIIHNVKNYLTWTFIIVKNGNKYFP